MALSLPTALTSKRDVLMIRREIERVLEALVQRRVAHTKADVQRALPTLSKRLLLLLEVNNLQLEEDSIRKIDEVLEEVYENAPQVRLSFASEPDQESLEKLVAWFRREAHPATFLQVGIQPVLAGGCVLRTPGHRYDFSLRTKLAANVTKLGEAITKASGPAVKTQTATAQSTVASSTETPTPAQNSESPPVAYQPEPQADHQPAEQPQMEHNNVG